MSRGTDQAPTDVVEKVRGLAARRMKREPMAYILGEREFWGLPFAVTPAVLVPRPDSETVIEAVLALMPDRGRPWRILDLGTGSGCLLLTLLHEYPVATGVGLDASPEALDVARRNARALGLVDRAILRPGDWRSPGWVDGIGGPFDLVVSNPPYIESDAIDGLMPEVGRHEPRLALDGGGDGLDAYRAITAAGPGLLAVGGYLVVEGGEGQVPEIEGLFVQAGLSPAGRWKDLGGIERVVAAHY